jgi:hypothetical protein
MVSIFSLLIIEELRGFGLAGITQLGYWNNGILE